MHIDSKESPHAHALLANDFPLRDKRLAARRPRCARGLNTARVEAQSGAVDDSGRVERAAGVGLVQTHERRLVEIRDADVASWRAAVFVVDGCDVDECVVWTSGGADGLGEGAQREVCGYDYAVLAWGAEGHEDTAGCAAQWKGLGVGC
jgi:hypothetical protein